MKKRILLPAFAAIIVTICSCVLFTSCENDDYWPYNPPSGWGSNYFFDSRLNGTWQLTQANASEVTLYDTNYMDFYGGGHGRYFYYRNGRPESEEMAYFCQRSGSTTTSYQINVQYEDGGASTMAYWFTDGSDTLWMQWLTTGGKTVTYIYTRVNSVPW